MTKDGYPSKKELEQIAKWPADDFMGLIYFIDDLWVYDKPSRKWEKDILGWHYTITYITCGWSGNESIINALMNNFWWNYWYYEWIRGGKHTFKINPKNLSFELVSDYCKKNNISRQAVYKSKHLYDFIKVSDRVVFCRKKN